jgi:enoyl-CoA hydratase/carnithine racemase
MASQLLERREGDVAILTLSNLEKRNALDPSLCEAIVRAIGGLAAGGVRAAVLTGAGDRAFSAGFDLTTSPAGQPVGEFVFDAMIDAVAASSVPIVAALNGMAFGGGCELAATCDLRIAHPGCKLAMPPAKLGIVYAARGLARFSALCGESRARAMFLGARTVEAEEALRWGLCDELVAPEEVLPRALARAWEMAALAPLSVQAARAAFEGLLRARAQLSAEDAAVLEGRRAAAWRSEDAAEARLAFAEKRPPTFHGR